jgi:hypothetical protein
MISSCFYYQFLSNFILKIFLLIFQSWSATLVFHLSPLMCPNFSCRYDCLLSARSYVAIVQVFFPSPLPLRVLCYDVLYLFISSVKLSFEAYYFLLRQTVSQSNSQKYPVAQPIKQTSCHQHLHDTVCE